MAGKGAAAAALEGLAAGLSAGAPMRKKKPRIQQAGVKPFMPPAPAPKPAAPQKEEEE